jgi:hypothetical protein
MSDGDRIYEAALGRLGGVRVSMDESKQRMGEMGWTVNDDGSYSRRIIDLIKEDSGLDPGKEQEVMAKLGPLASQNDELCIVQKISEGKTYWVVIGDNKETDMGGEPQRPRRKKPDNVCERMFRNFHRCTYLRPPCVVENTVTAGSMTA